MEESDRIKLFLEFGERLKKRSKRSKEPKDVSVRIRSIGREIIALIDHGYSWTGRIDGKVEANGAKRAQELMEIGRKHHLPYVEKLGEYLQLLTQSPLSLLEASLKKMSPRKTT